MTKSTKRPLVFAQKSVPSPPRADGKFAKIAAAKVATVSHTLESALAERLREFAFRERISESAVIEHALLAFFEQGNDAALGARLRGLGAALRRKI